MSSIRYSDEQIASILRSADRMIERRYTISEICQHHGISRGSLYRWQRRFGIRTETRTDQAEDDVRKTILQQEEMLAAMRIAAEGN